jgi:anti-sigma regulatory factor (Ser/Thr protein kinase)
MSSTSELRLELPARAENIAVVRQALAGLGEAWGLEPERVADVKTVITEACNNVVLHAYPGDPGPLEVQARANTEGIEFWIRDRGAGFRPAPRIGDTSLGLGLPLIASLSEEFEVRGRAGGGTEILVRFGARAVKRGNGPGRGRTTEETAMLITPGELARPVLARVIAALAARADLSVDRLADTVLIGDAVSSHRPDDFSGGRVGITIRDGAGKLHVRVGPLVEGGGERILSGMDIPGEGGSLRTLAQEMRVTSESAGGRSNEYLEFEVDR